MPASKDPGVLMDQINENIISVGVSSCLLGENVRWNGGHQLNHFIRDILGRFFRFVPVCPEFECGFGVPREPLRLTGDPDRPRLVTSKTGIDVTQRMEEWSSKKLEELDKENLCGFIFKSKSPSSGLFRVKVYNDRGYPAKHGTGAFARSFVSSFPLVPVEEDGRLCDDDIRENFIERIFVFKRWRLLLEMERKIRCIMDFHTRHKYLIMAHSPKHYSLMGKLVAGVTMKTLETDLVTYGALLNEAMALKATRAKHVNVLQHMSGYFKKHLTADEKAELCEIIEHYRAGSVPLIVPVTLINHYVRKTGEPYLENQIYLKPHPLELKLRNHA
jgi:uncharacterized protein YbgA (DUF1722 family)/uncharacterized protein YbbK (DUF523 family)